MTGYHFVMQQFSNNKLILQPVSYSAESLPDSLKKLTPLNVATINIVTTYWSSPSTSF